MERAADDDREGGSRDASRQAAASTAAAVLDLALVLASTAAASALVAGAAGLGPDSLRSSVLHSIRLSQPFIRFVKLVFLPLL